jgi:hypothetical protein
MHLLAGPRDLTDAHVQALAHDPLLLVPGLVVRLGVLGELAEVVGMPVGEWAEEKRRLADELSGGGGGSADGDDGHAA